jgi:ethanolamine utilization protein EutN
MFVGKVVGTLWSTKKTVNIQSLRFLVVHPYDLDHEPTRNIVVAADVLGAGIGELVMVAYGRAARLAIGDENASIEAAVVGIIDELEIDREEVHSDSHLSYIRWRERSDAP